jgi:hypothetical protein
MNILRTCSLALAITGAAFASAAAQTIVKKEPPKGALRSGQVVLVDDGSCGPGKIKEVRGGKEESSVRRTRSCVPRP